MKAKAKKRFDNNNILRLELSQKLRKSSDRLQEGCGWLINLAEAIEYAPDRIKAVCDQLESLRKRIKRGSRLDGRELRDIVSALRRLDSYSQSMKSTKEPLSVLGIMDDAALLEHHQDRLADIIDR